MSLGEVEAAGEPQLFTLEPCPGTEINRRLTLVRSDGQSAVSTRGTPLYCWDSADLVSERVVMVSLARSGLAKHRHLARAFRVHENTVARSVRRAEAGGLAALIPAKRGPKGPSKITPAVIAEMERGRDLGLRASEIAERVAERCGIQLSRTHLAHVLKTLPRPQPVQPILLDEPAHGEQASAVAPAGPAPHAGSAAPLAPGEEPPVLIAPAARGRYLGASLYYGALGALGVLEAAAACFRLPGAERFGVRAVTLTLFYLCLLGNATVEAAKHLRRFEFGPLIGAGRAPVVRTLRRKLAELVTQDGAVRFGEMLGRRWVEQAVVATAYLYVDGHMKVYSGQRKLAEVWNAQRRMPLAGTLSYFVGDRQGRPLLFLTEEANASLARAMPRIVAAIRGVLGERPFSVIFDRGGYDGKLFRWLRAEQIDFITYQRGSPRLSPDRFRRHEARFEGRRVRMALAEDEVKVGGSGPWRRIVVRTKKGHQTPILTSLASDLGAARIACLMFARWRQENFFRYMRERCGLDRLLGYAYAPADGSRLVKNPERTTIEGELAACRASLAALQAGLGQAVLGEPRRGSRSAHGLKVAQQGAVKKVRELEARISELVAQRQALPAQVPLAQAGERERLRLEEKAIIDRIKIAAYNAEEWLLERLVRHYPNPHDVRDLLRSFAQLAGEIRTTAGGVTITLDPPDIPAHRRALRGLCEDLNQLGTTFPGTAIPVRYDVAVHHSELAA